MGMVYVWVTLYGLTYTFSEMLLQPNLGDFQITPWIMLLYALILCIWICRTDRNKMIGLCITVPGSLGEGLKLLPLFLLSAYNLMTAEDFTLELPGAALLLGVAVTEEIFFRGFLLTFLAKHSKIAGIYLSSVLFAVLHVVNLSSNTVPAYTWMQVICAFVSGLCYSSTAIRFRSIFPCIAAHFLTNITGSIRPLKSYLEMVGLWICIAVYAFLGIRQSYEIWKFDKEKQS